MKRVAKKVLCDQCHNNMAPLKLANMFIDNEYEVRVICSPCILRTPAKDLFGKDGPVPWPSRFYNNMAPIRKNWDGLAIVMTILGMLFIMGAALCL